MKTVVIIPGGYHPFHQGHLALYNQAKKRYPGADVYLAATDVQTERPFPFRVKQSLAKLAGIPNSEFVQVKSPFAPREILSKYNPDDTVVIFVRSDKDRDQSPKPGYTKKDGSPGYLQPAGKDMKTMSQFAYMDYVPTVTFGADMTSATQIRQGWPDMNDQQRRELVATLYPKISNNNALLDKTIDLLSSVLGESVSEATLINDPESGLQIRPSGGIGTYDEQSLRSSAIRDLRSALQALERGMYSNTDYVLYKNTALTYKIRALKQLEDFQEKQGARSIAKGREIDLGEDYVVEKWSEKYKRSIDCNNPKGFSQKAHCAGRNKK